VTTTIIRIQKWGKKNKKTTTAYIYVLIKDTILNTKNRNYIIKQSYVLHIPIKKKKKGTNNDKDITRPIPNIKKYSPKRWVVERTNSWHNRFRKLFTCYEKKAENCLGRTVQFSPVVLLSIEN
jgi:transposase